MRLKYFLRGLGTGIIFGAIIMLAAYLTSGSYKLTDEEIINRASDLGMTFESDTATASDTISEEEAETDTTTAEITTEATTEEETENVTTEATEATTEEITEETTDETTEKSSDEGDYTVAEITVIGGMGSQDIAGLLEEAGMIDDADDFDNYLNANGYSTKLEVGTFEINSNMTYEEMAEILSTKQ